MSEQWEPGLTRELRDTLVRHAEEGSGRPTDLATVQGRAQRIRRNRRATVAGGLAAVVAIAAPLAVAGLDALRADGPPPVTTTPHSELKVPYARGTTLVLPDGSVRELPQKFQEGALLGNDFFGAAGDEGSGELQLTQVDASGEATDSEIIWSNLASNRDASVLAYAKEGGQQVLRDRGGELDLDAPKSFSPRGVLGGPDCAATQECVVFGSTNGVPAILGPDLGFVVPGQVTRLDDLTRSGLMAVETKSTETGPCGGVYDAAAGAMRFEDCQWIPTRFSSDGTYVLAQQQTYGNLGPSQPTVGVLDSTTGAVLASYVPSKHEVVTNWMWEDGSHVLIQVHRAEGWYVLRMGVGGTTTAALGPFDNGSDTIAGYTLLGQTM